MHISQQRGREHIFRPRQELRFAITLCKGKMFLVFPAEEDQEENICQIDDHIPSVRGFNDLLK